MISERTDFEVFINRNRLKKKDIAEYLGVSSAFITALCSGTRPIPMDKFDLIKSNPNWDTSMFGVGTEARPKSISEFVQVPLVPIRAKAGYLVGYGDDGYIQTLPTVPVITDRTFHGKYRCFEVEGDSMDDGTRSAICDRDVILGREVGRQLWTCKLHYKDWLFVIVHQDGILIKQIVDHKVDEGIIICHSRNPLYGEDFEVRLDEVSELYNVIKIVDRNAKL